MHPTHPASAAHRPTFVKALVQERPLPGEPMEPTLIARQRFAQGLLCNNGARTFLCTTRPTQNTVPVAEGIKRNPSSLTIHHPLTEQTHTGVSKCHEQQPHQASNNFTSRRRHRTCGRGRKLSEPKREDRRTAQVTAHPNLLLQRPWLAHDHLTLQHGSHENVLHLFVHSCCGHALLSQCLTLCGR